MPIMNLLVAFNGSDASVAGLRYAASIARERGAHVTAILAHSTHQVIDRSSRWIPTEARALLDAANADIIRDIEATFDALRDELGLGEDLSFQERAGPVDAILSEAARAFDVIIVGRHLDDDDEHVSLHPDRIALLSGRPVIVVPEGFDTGGQHHDAALAWDGGRAAARALSDSLRLLEAEGTVSVLTIGKHKGAPLEDLLAHLGRHGIAASHKDLPDAHSVADTILAYCKQYEPSLLVMGAYEHSKFREDFLGGVTANVLRDIRIPVLLSH